MQNTAQDYFYQENPKERISNQGRYDIRVPCASLIYLIGASLLWDRLYTQALDDDGAFATEAWTPYRSSKM